MFKLANHCALSHASKGNAQNPLSQASTVCELRTSRCKAGFRKGRGTKDEVANICWIIEKARELKKKKNTCFIDSAKAFDFVYQSKED